MSDQPLFRRIVPLAAAFLLCFILITTVAAPGSRAQPGGTSPEVDRVLRPGAAVTGTITSGAGDRWQFLGCAGDVITATMASDAFVPYTEINTDTVEALATSELDAGGAAVVSLDLLTTARYTLLASGDRRSDRGAYTLTLAIELTATLPAVDGVIAPGEEVTGTIRSGAGQAWLLYACAGDVLTVTMTSDAFAPYLEIFTPGVDEPLATGEDGNGTTQVAGLSLQANTMLQLAAAGAARRDRGTYTLTVESAAGGLTTTLPTENGVAPGATPTPPAAPTPTPQAAAATLVCSTNNAAVNLRAGPGTTYSVVRPLVVRTVVRATARTTTGDWLQVETQTGSLTGWIAAQLLNCNGPVSGLPPGIIPPTPSPAPATATATPTATPTPTNTPPPVAVQPTPTLPALVGFPGGPGGGFDGQFSTERGMIVGSDDFGNPVFRDRMYFRLDVFQTQDDEPVDRVDMAIMDENGEDVYVRPERTPAYCSFAGGEPNCNVLFLRDGVTWPDTNTPIRNSQYTAQARLFLPGDEFPSATWDQSFTIDSPELQGNGGDGGDTGVRPDLLASIVHTGPGNTEFFLPEALEFRVDAFDPSVGSNNGDGIADVDMVILGPDGDPVHDRTEGSAAYCIFEGGEPDCNIWNFADNGFTWPSGNSVEPGVHTLRATVNAEDGRSVTLETTVELP